MTHDRALQHVSSVTQHVCFIRLLPCILVQDEGEGFSNNELMDAVLSIKSTNQPFQGSATTSGGWEECEASQMVAQVSAED